MQDPIDRHVEAEDLWESLQDAQGGDDGDYAADLAKDSGLDRMAMLTGEWAAAAELATKRMREVYDKVRPGPDPQI